MTSNDDVVYVRAVTGGSHANVYHTDQNCPKLADVENVHTYSVQAIDRTGKRECKVCRDGWSTSGGGPNDHYNALVNAAKDD